MIRYLILIIFIIPIYVFSQKPILPITLKSLHTPLYSKNTQMVYYDWESKNSKCEKYFGKIKSINHIICTIKEESKPDNLDNCNEIYYQFNLDEYCIIKKTLKYPGSSKENYITENYTYEFDNTGKVINTFINGKLPSWGNKQGSGIKIELLKSVYEYDEIGNVISVFNPNIDDKTSFDVTNTEYLEYDGCNVKLYWKLKEGKRLRGYREIGLNNQIFKEVYYVKKWDKQTKKELMEKNVIEFVYTFDRIGNWITRFTYVNSDLKYIDNREIQYYR